MYVVYDLINKFESFFYTSIEIFAPVDFVFSKDAFKTIKAYVKNFISVIKSEILRSKGEESSCTTRALEDWESCGYSLVKTLIIKEICDYMVDLEKFIKLNISAMHQEWNHRSKNNGERISERNKIERRIFSNQEKIIQIDM